VLSVLERRMRMKFPDVEGKKKKSTRAEKKRTVSFNFYTLPKISFRNEGVIKALTVKVKLRNCQ
jgi:hypothetical protein